MWQNSITQNVTKLKNLKCDKTQKLRNMTKLENSNVTKIKNSKFEEKIKN